MTRLMHVFFDLHGTLIDARERLPVQYRSALGEVMAARYGGDPAEWAEANRRVVADWDSYYADLDLGGDDSLEQMREGQARTLRALFRLTGRSYPASDELARLIDEHAFAITRRCDALYPDVRPSLADLRALGLTLGLFTHSLQGHAEGLLIGAGVREIFEGPVVTSDVRGVFAKEEGGYRIAARLAGVEPGQCAAVDDDPGALRAAAQAGLRTVGIARRKIMEASAAEVILPDLAGLADVLRGWQ
jgi:FMN phosphatase YigB (HAD superfamily)